MTNAQESNHIQGEQITAQGEYSPKLFYVVDGELESTTQRGSGVVLKWPISGGCLFGEITVFSGTFRAFSTVSVISETATIRCLNLPMIFQYFLLEPVVAMRFYVLVGKRLSRLLQAADLHSEGALEESAKVLQEVSVTKLEEFELINQEPSEGLSSSLFRQLFPSLSQQNVLCECDGVLETSLRSRKVVIYITHNTFNYVDQGKGLVSSKIVLMSRY